MSAQGLQLVAPPQPTAAVELPSSGAVTAVIRTNLAYARMTRGQFPHARALVMVEGIRNLIWDQQRRTSSAATQAGEVRRDG